RLRYSAAALWITQWAGGCISYRAPGAHPPGARCLWASVVIHRCLWKSPLLRDAGSPECGGQCVGFYQTRTPPTRDTRTATRRKDCDMANSQNRGLTASAAYTPFGGLTSPLRKFRALDPADFRAVVWAGILAAATIAVGAWLAQAGYLLPHIWALLALSAIAA